MFNSKGFAFASLFVSLLASTAIAQSTDFADSTAGLIAIELINRTTKEEPRFAKFISPAQSLNDSATTQARITENNKVMMEEIATVLDAFTGAPASEKIAATRAAVARFDNDTARSGASRTFKGSSPASSVLRQLLFVPTSAIRGENAAERVMQMISSFERAPKPDDLYFEYSFNSKDTTDPSSPEKVIALPLQKAKVRKIVGTENSHLVDSKTAMQPGAPYVLKKCVDAVVRYYCNTSVYQVAKIAAPDSDTMILLTRLYNLRTNPNSGSIPRSSQKENAAEGYTGLYVVKTSGDLVLVYNLGVQHMASDPGYHGRINEGQKREHRLLIERITNELKIRSLPF